MINYDKETMRLFQSMWNGATAYCFGGTMEDCGRRFCSDPEEISNGGVEELRLGGRTSIVRSITHGLNLIRSFRSALPPNDPVLPFLSDTESYLLNHPHLPWR